MPWHTAEKRPGGSVCVFQRHIFIRKKEAGEIPGGKNDAGVIRLVQVNTMRDGAKFKR